MAREHCFYEDIFNYIVHGTYWTDASDVEKDKLHKESTSYSVVQGNLFHLNSSTKKLQQVILNQSDRKSAIFDCHIKEDTGDHLNAKTTYFNLRKKYHWKNMDNDVSNFIEACQECGFTSNGDVIDSKSNEPKEFLDRVWKLVEVDIIGPLQFHEKEMFLLRLTDIFSKWMSYNLLSEINFKDISNMLLHEFSMVGFPLGIRLVGVENSEKLVDTFEIALKDFMDNVNKINLLLNKDNKQSETKNPIMSDCKDSIPKNNDDNEENVQNGVDCNILNASENIEKNGSVSVDELDCKNFENGCEVNDESCLEQNNEAKEGTLCKLGIKNCENESDIGDSPTTELKIKNYKNGDESSGETNDVSISSQIKHCEDDIQMTAEANLTTESEMKDCENDIECSKEANITSVTPQIKNCENDNQIVDEVNETTGLEMKDCKNDVEFSEETKITNSSPQVKNYEINSDITIETKIATTEQQQIANCEHITEADNETMSSVIEPEIENRNHQPNNKKEASLLQQNSLPSNMTQSLLSMEEELKSDINANTPVIPQNKSDVTHKEDLLSLNNTPVVKRIKESENICEELGDFETFLKSSEVKENCMNPLLYVFLVQQSLLDSETQNVCRTYLQKFIKLFPDSWTDNLSHFNFHIRNSVSPSFQTPNQLLLHRDPHLLGLYKNRSLSKNFQYLQKETLNADNIGKGSQGSLESKQAHLPVREGYTMRPLPTSTSVRRHSRYGLRKSPKPKDSLGISDQCVKSQKRSAGEDEKQKDCTPPLKTRRLSPYHSKRLSSVKQKATEKILKNYSLKSPIIVLTPLPCSVVDGALHGKTDVLSLEKYIRLSCNNASD